MANTIRAEFEDRFLDQFAGMMVRDPQTAIIELVANAWDAYATKVKIKWPDDSYEFSIEDNGHGLTATEFRNIWKRLSYDRIERFGTLVQAPPELGVRRPRRVFGRNGKGRLAGLYFAESYVVETWKDGESNTFKVSKAKPLSIEHLATVAKKGHGLRITVKPTRQLETTSEWARQIIGNRFLFDPEFKIAVNGVAVTFNDLPANHVSEHTLPLDGDDSVRAIVIDSALPHETTHAHGVAWWVNGRSVGNITWIWPPAEPLLDGRSSAAKRYSIVLVADCMSEAIRPDWSGFESQSEKWKQYAPRIREFVGEILDQLSHKEKRSTLDRAVAGSKRELEQLTKIDRDRWSKTLDELMEKCPSLSDTEITQVMNILAKMEVADSQYSLLARLDQMDPADIDGWDDIWSRWSASTAKVVLGEIETRLKLVAEIDRFTKDKKTDEVHDLQPLFKKALWVFGPEFDSIEYTSNQRIATVVRKLMGVDSSTSRLRPDFVALPDASVGFYAHSTFGDDNAEEGIASLVIVELKKPGIPIGTKEKNQVWGYVLALLKDGAIQSGTKVHCHIMGESIAEYEGDVATFNPMTTVKPMTYDTFVKRGESRLFKLRAKIRESDAGQKALLGETEVDKALQSLLL